MTNDIHSPISLRHSGGQLTLRPLTLSDLQLVCLVENRSHRYPWRTAHIQSSLTHHFCYGLFSGDQRLCAHAFLSHILDEVELLLFVVDRDHQNQGLGKMFLAHVLEMAAANARTMFLEVRRSNSPAIALYESCGFNQVGVRPAYYPPADGRKPEDALIYACELGLSC